MIFGLYKNLIKVISIISIFGILISCVSDEELFPEVIKDVDKMEPGFIDLKIENFLKKNILADWTNSYSFFSHF